MASSAADRNTPTAHNRAQRDETRQPHRHYARRAWHRPGGSMSRNPAATSHCHSGRSKTVDPRRKHSQRRENDTAFRPRTILEPIRNYPVGDRPRTSPDCSSTAPLGDAVCGPPGVGESGPHECVGADRHAVVERHHEGVVPSRRGTRRAMDWAARHLPPATRPPERAPQRSPATAPSRASRPA